MLKDHRQFFEIGCPRGHSAEMNSESIHSTLACFKPVDLARTNDPPKTKLMTLQHVQNENHQCSQDLTKPALHTPLVSLSPASWSESTMSASDAGTDSEAGSSNELFGDAAPPTPSVSRVEPSRIESNRYPCFLVPPTRAGAGLVELGLAFPPT